MDLITIERKAGKAFELKVRGHTLTIDMSKEEGGADEGMNPVELLASSLGACIAIMVQTYCDTHGYTDGNVAASLTLQIADDPKRVGNVVIDLELPKDFPEDKRSVVERLAELCPVHETLKQMPTVDLDIV
jgi:putative redox protein